MSKINKKKESFSFIGNKNQINEIDEELRSDSDHLKEDRKNKIVMDITDPMDDSFSESFYKEILEDSENEEVRNVAKNSKNEKSEMNSKKGLISEKQEENKKTGKIVNINQKDLKTNEKNNNDSKKMDKIKPSEEILEVNSFSKNQLNNSKIVSKEVPIQSNKSNNSFLNKQDTSNEEEIYEAENFEEKNSLISKEINNDNSIKERKSKDGSIEESRISKNKSRRDIHESEDPEYIFDEKDKIDDSGYTKNSKLSKSQKDLKQEEEENQYNDFQNSQNSIKEDKISESNKTNNISALITDENNKSDKINEIKNNLNPNKNNKISINKIESKNNEASKRNVTLNKNKAQKPSSGYSNSIKYSFNPNFISDPNNFLGKDKKLNSSKKVSNSLINTKFASTSNSKINPLNKNINNNNTIRSNNYSSSNGEQFKCSLNREISKIMDKIGLAETSPPKIKTNFLLNSNKKNKSNSKSKNNTLMNKSNFSSKKTDEFIAPQNNLFYESNNNFNGLNNENTFNEKSQMNCESKMQSQRPFSSKLGSSMSKSKIYKAISPIRKLEKEKDEYFRNLKKIKSNYENLNENRNKNFLEKKTNNKNEIINLKNKIPLSYDNIDENKELVRLLLKKPTAMTIEEKVYINSLDDKEFKRLIEYLKVKSRELKWRGNDLGSGHYNELYIKIDRETEKYLNDRYTKLKNFLKLNFNNNQALEYLKQAEQEEVAKRRAEKLRLEAKFDGVEINSNEIYDEHKVLQDKIKVDKFINKSKEMLKELDSFKTIIIDHKTQMQIEKINYQNNLIYRDLDQKMNFFREDVKKMEEFKGLKSSEGAENDYFRKIDEFKIKNKNLYENFANELSRNSIIKKIQDYCIKSRINSVNLVRSLNNVYVPNDGVDLEIVKKNLIKLSILSEEEAEFFIQKIREYRNEEIKIDYIICLIDDQFAEQKLNGKENEYKGVKNTYLDDLYKDSDDELLEIYNNDDDYDYFNFDLDHEQRLLEKKKRVIETKNIEDYRMVFIRKATLLIQKNYRKHISTNKLKVLKINKILLINRIIRAVRRFLAKIRMEKDNAAHKIQYILKSNYKNNRIFNNIKFNSKYWLRQKDPFRNFAATIIQRYWRAYRLELLDLFYDDIDKKNIPISKTEKKKKKNSIDKNLATLHKTKLCFICRIEKVTHLCRSCSNNLYCERCFNKFHCKGAKGNHMYIKLKEVTEERKKKSEIRPNNKLFLDEASYIKEYLEKKGFDLNEHLKNWDFQENGSIKYRNLKDSISEKFFDFDPDIRDKLLEFSLRYTMDDYAKENDDEKFINYEKMCFDLV